MATTDTPAEIPRGVRASWGLAALVGAAALAAVYQWGTAPAAHGVLREEVPLHPVRVLNKVPVVLLVFDPLPPSAPPIDAERLPHLRALAQEATIYENATANHARSSSALLALLSGRYPPADSEAVTPARDTLFTLLGASYRARIVDPGRTPVPGNLADASLYGPSRADRLWRRLRGVAPGSREGTPAQRAAALRRMLTDLGPADQEALVYAYVELPVSPDAPATCDQALGELVAALKAQGIYTPALLVVTATRGAASGTPEAMAPVPLLIKLPGQHEGRVDDRNVELVDLLPTIADTLGVKIPWEVDGISLLSPAAVKPPRKVFFTRDGQRRELPPLTK